MDEIKQFLQIAFTFYRRNPASTIKMLLEISLTRYLIIGLSSLALSIGILEFCVRTLSIQKDIANIIALTLTLIFNFTMSNFWSFKAGKGQKAKKSSRYITLATFNYFAQIAIFSVTVRLLIKSGTSPDVARMLTVCIGAAVVMCWNFFLYKHWVFVKES